MNSAEWVEIIQLIATLVTCAFIIWYTIDTHAIRHGTTSQAVLTPNAKIWDRQNELDRLLFLHPDVAKEYENLANHKNHYFTAPADVVPRDKLYYQLKELVYLHLNFFEAIYTTTTSSPAVTKQFEREAWHDFIFQSMDHALLREVFHNEMGITYTGEFLKFMIKEKDKWKGDVDSNIS
jgi:hypothetical protein